MLKAYEPQLIEPRWAEFWVKEQLFRADVNAPGPCLIAIPLPNVTGSLHIGHMLDHTEIDILTRPRMRGYNTLICEGPTLLEFPRSAWSCGNLTKDQLSGSWPRGVRAPRLERKEESGGAGLQRQMREIGESSAGRARNLRFRRSCHV